MEKPTFSQRMKSLGLFLWNGETKEFLGRGGRSWAEIGLFYLVFYGCLAGFFIATIAVFYETIDRDNPRLQGDSSLLKGNPGMGYQPMPDIQTTLIYARTSEEDTLAYVKSINKVLAVYKNESLNRVNCSDLTQPRTDGDKACNFDFANLTQECNEDNYYGLKDGQPCILLKLNKIFGWVPSVWEAKEISDVNIVPKHINYTADRIWVHCHGENPADDDNLGALDQIKYFPQQGFSLGYYPYKKQLDYLSPLVFVKFLNVTQYVGVMVECLALGKNIALDRSERQGAEIGLFYLIYYACLAGFFAATIAVFYETIDADNPRLQGDSSLLKGNPGMGFQPMPDIETTLVYSRKDLAKNKEYVKSISKVLKAYKDDSIGVDCDGFPTPRVDVDTACKVNFSALTENCNEANGFGMNDGKPCVLLKLNKIYGWTPQVWKSDELPDQVPSHIKSQYSDDRIWIDCHGENPADLDNLGEIGDIEYFPQQGFPLAYYPYRKQKDYRSPLVFVKFNNPTNYVGIMIECKALAKNINVDRSEKEGSVHFELLVE